MIEHVCAPMKLYLQKGQVAGFCQWVAYASPRVKSESSWHTITLSRGVLGGLWYFGSRFPELTFPMGQLWHLKWLSPVTAWDALSLAQKSFGWKWSAQEMLIQCPSVNLGIHGDSIVYDRALEDKRTGTKSPEAPDVTVLGSGLFAKWLPTISPIPIRACCTSHRELRSVSFPLKMSWPWNVLWAVEYGRRMVVPMLTLV